MTAGSAMSGASGPTPMVSSTRSSVSCRRSASLSGRLSSRSTRLTKSRTYSARASSPPPIRLRALRSSRSRPCSPPLTVRYSAALGGSRGGVAPPLLSARGRSAGAAGAAAGFSLTRFTGRARFVRASRSRGLFGAAGLSVGSLLMADPLQRVAGAAVGGGRRQRGRLARGEPAANRWSGWPTMARGVARLPCHEPSGPASCPCPRASWRRGCTAGRRWQRRRHSSGTAGRSRSAGRAVRKRPPA